MSIYSALRYRISNRANWQSILHDMVTRIEYLEQLINKEEVLDPHSPSTQKQAINPVIGTPAPGYIPKKQGRSRLTWYKLARQGDRDAVEWLISQHMHMLEKRDEELAHACTHIENLLPFARVSKMRSYREKGKLSSGLRQRDPIVRDAELFLNPEDDEL